MRLAIPLFALSVLLPVAADASQCTLGLVLATDVSSSIDENEYHAQMHGMAEAFRTDLLRDALLNSPGTHVEITVVHWSGYKHQEQVVPWTALTDRATLDRFADAIADAPRRHDDQATSLGKGLQFSARLTHSRTCDRLIIDLTGDGTNNYGIGPHYFAERGLFDSLTVNGLVIRGATPDPEPYYRDEVLHGPGAFLLAVDSYADYAQAILKKLLREISPRYTMAR